METEVKLKNMIMDDRRPQKQGGITRYGHMVDLLEIFFQFYNRNLQINSIFQLSCFLIILFKALINVEC